ncbi:hypothetical protein K450DRAFT_255845 [Umbelopsis ramanniana AG]|uniref:RING-type domain-containing protein n=1 Tax=Umbelopsis ramanniana AG TaxID=1314678 RepID=A0AAD5E4K5_UMBRA|nr:uncharacterized protein K450DRAFT_255845 [Umbelopsis ramanniana AG]KAI8576612.1 hypothetical protein K450DRAFT_255845 [Umbelopsis ramanniana AG]
MSNSTDSSNSALDSSKLSLGIGITAALLVIVGALLCLQILRYRYLDIHNQFYGVSQPSHIGVLANTTLSNNSIELLPIHSYVDIEENVSNRGDYDICAVCLDQFEENISQVRKLPCNHIFHAACIDPWLKDRSGFCPICKASAHIKAKQKDKGAHEDEIEHSAAVTQREDFQQHLIGLRTELTPHRPPPLDENP